MKIKLSWIPFIPAVLAMTVLRVISVFSNDGSATDVISKNAVMISYIAVGIALVLFVLCILFNILDRKTAPVYAVKRNAPAGVCSVLSAAFALAYSVISIINRNGNDYLLIYIICTFFAILAAIGLVFMARTHFSGFAPVSNISFLYVFPSLWAVSELILCFMEATKLSVSASDMSLLFCFIFLVLGLFAQSMVIAKIPGRNPVKASLLYGLPSASFGISYGVYLLAGVIVGNQGGSALMTGLMLVSFALYEIFFMIEITRGALEKDNVKIVGSSPENDLDSIRRKDNDGNTDFTDNENPVNIINDDFIMGYMSDDEIPEAPVLKEQTETDDDLSGDFYFGIKQDEEEKSSDDILESVQDALEARKQKKEEKLQDEIDKLLAELEEHQQNLDDDR